jgi:hypothetical protein
MKKIRIAHVGLFFLGIGLFTKAVISNQPKTHDFKIPIYFIKSCACPLLFGQPLIL